jgi:zinc transport system substrate-binding protein
LKKPMLFSLILILALTSCGSPATQGEIEKLTISVSVLPQQWFVDQIGGDRVRTQAMVGTGDDPHTYEPSPQQMTNLADSELYFTIGVEFEAMWLPRFESANPEMKVVDSAAGIERIPAAGELEIDSKVEDNTNTSAETDPHIWFSPSRMKQMAQTMAEAMQVADPQNADFYQANLDALLIKIDEVDTEVKTQLEGLKRDHFMVVHPAWGYVAEDYGLHMLAVEIGGNEPAPETLSKIITLAREYEINTLVIEKGSNARLASAITEQAGIQSVVEWDPMAYDWPASMLMIAETLHQALN